MTLTLPKAPQDATVEVNGIYQDLASKGGGPMDMPVQSLRMTGKGLWMNRNAPVELNSPLATTWRPDAGATAITYECPVVGAAVAGGAIRGVNVVCAPTSTAIVLINAGRLNVEDFHSAGGVDGIVCRNSGAGMFSENNRLTKIYIEAASGSHIRMEVTGGGDASFENTVWQHTRTVPRAGDTSRGLDIRKGVSLAAVYFDHLKCDAMGGSTCVYTDCDMGGLKMRLQVEGLRGTGNHIWELGPDVRGQSPQVPTFAGWAQVAIDVIGKAWEPDRFPRALNPLNPGQPVKPLHVLAPPSTWPTA